MVGLAKSKIGARTLPLQMSGRLLPLCQLEDYSVVENQYIQMPNRGYLA
jgi:hypothetical protein